MTQVGGTLPYSFYQLGFQYGIMMVCLDKKSQKQVLHWSNNYRHDGADNGAYYVQLYSVK